MDLQWKDEPSQVAGTLVQGRGRNRSSVPLAMLLSGGPAWPLCSDHSLLWERPAEG